MPSPSALENHIKMKPLNQKRSNQIFDSQFNDFKNLIAANNTRPDTRASQIESQTKNTDY